MTHVNVVNSESGTLTNVQVMVHLDETNWDWSGTGSDPDRIRVITGNTGVGAAIPFWIAAWDATNQLGHIIVKMASLPVGTTPIMVVKSTPDSSISSVDILTRWDTADLFANVDWSEGSGTAPVEKVGPITGVMKGTPTWLSGDGGAFGNNLVSAPFTGGHHVEFDGVDDAAFFPGLMTDSSPVHGTISLWLESLRALPANGEHILCVQRYSVVYLRLMYTSSNEVSFIIQSSDNDVIEVATLPGMLGETYGVLDGNKHHLACTWGANGAALWIDGVLADRHTSYTKSPGTIGQDSSTGAPAAGLAIGCQYDPRVGLSSGFANFRISHLQIFNKQMEKTEIDQLRHRLTRHPITTAFERLVYQGFALHPDIHGTAYNDRSWEEASAFVQAGKVVMYARAGIQGTQPVTGTVNGSRVCRSESTDGITFSEPTQVLGMGHGGYSLSVTGPEIFVDTDNGDTLYLFVSNSQSDGSFFGHVAYATTTDGGLTWTYQGRPNLHGGDDSMFSANHDMILVDGEYILLYEGQESGTPWQTYIAKGSSPLDLVPNATRPPNLGFSGNGVAGPTNGGPDIHPVGSRYLTLCHSGIPSVIYARTGPTPEKYLWGFYDIIANILPFHFPGERTNQTADASMIEFGGDVLLYHDDIVGGAAPGGIGVSKATGMTIADLILPTVRADVLLGTDADIIIAKPSVSVESLTGTLNFTLTWGAVSGTVIKYRVYKNDVELTTSPGQDATTYTITGATFGDVFTVKAIDNVGRESALGRFAVPADLSSGGGGGFYHRYSGSLG